MEIKYYLSVVYKRLWIVIVLPLVALLTSTYLSYFVLDPIYETNTTLYVINRSSDSERVINYSDFLAGEQLVKDYTELIKSRTVTGAVIDKLNLQDMTTSDLVDTIEVRPMNDTRIIEIKVQHKDPETVMNIANSLADEFSDSLISLMEVDNVSIIDRAVLPKYPIAPNPVKNFILALFSSIIIALGLIFFIEYLDNTIKTTEDVEKYLNLPVIGIIPELELK
ncbi:MAG: YveK family protein [Clostridia bacterium]